MNFSIYLIWVCTNNVFIVGEKKNEENKYVSKTSKLYFFKKPENKICFTFIDNYYFNVFGVIKRNSHYAFGKCDD